MTFSKIDFAARLTKAADALLAKSDYLSEVDAKFGDGDHGTTIKRISELIKSEVASWPDGEPFGEFFAQLGKGIMGISSGSSCPLWGTMFEGFGKSLTGKFELASPDIVTMFTDALAEMQEITTAQIGDKTMMDVLIPVVEEVKKLTPDVKPEDIFKAAAAAAAKGCKTTEEFVSKFGRAKSYEEQTIGTPDVGAVSLATLFEGLAAGIAKEGVI